mgnify:CR=1 FL=1
MKHLLIIIFCTPLFLKSQISTDGERLNNMGYMKLSSKINCDSTSGSNLEHKICLNQSFQKLDSTLNSSYLQALNVIERDSLKTLFVKGQKQWLKNRHTQSFIRSEGYRGHLLGIKYLSFMVLTTQNRIEELKSLTLD